MPRLLIELTEEELEVWNGAAARFGAATGKPLSLEVWLKMIIDYYISEEYSETRDEA